jgi:hypothetical protein
MGYLGSFGNLPLSCAAGGCGNGKEGDENNQGDKNTAGQ